MIKCIVFIKMYLYQCYRAEKVTLIYSLSGVNCINTSRYYLYDIIEEFLVCKIHFPYDHW